ncbi:MAG: PIN domain-containing protein [Micrococcales bacterium]|nr:PIN domain-containing protein [Micrococcales bacterium]
MKLVDANVLLYATNRQARPHDAAHAWLTNALAGGEAVPLPWVGLLAFIRVSTSPRILAAPLTAADAMTIMSAWLAAPSAVTVHPTARHAGLLAGLLEQAGTAGNLTTDAHLAALALEHGAQVVTFDRDFARFGVGVFVPPPA